mmetsp:Transcript_118484/g.297947  ORF Transcript_118484/g.297947 Transcript_118484/m.297947 type:complete len:206 (-) Transcript_118484:113-730(-)
MSTWAWAPMAPVRTPSTGSAHVTDSVWRAWTRTSSPSPSTRGTMSRAISSICRLEQAVQVPSTHARGVRPACTLEAVESGAACTAASTTGPRALLFLRIRARGLRWRQLAIPWWPCVSTPGTRPFACLAQVCPLVSASTIRRSSMCRESIARSSWSSSRRFSAWTSRKATQRPTSGAQRASLTLTVPISARLRSRGQVWTSASPA